MRLEQHPPSDFTKIRFGRKLVYLHRDVAPLASELLPGIDQLLRTKRRGAGNRASGHAMKLDGAPALFVRRSKRGGMMRFLGDLYVGFIPRVIHELIITSEARKRGVPAAEPMGAIVERLAPGIHRELLVTRAIPGMTLWEFVRTDDDPRVRGHVIRLARHAIDTMHELGVFHADLNLHNLFVSTEEDGFSVVILDFDKSRAFTHAVPKALRRRNLRRLARSAHKLDPRHRYIDASALKILTAP